MPPSPSLLSSLDGGVRGVQFAFSSRAPDQAEWQVQSAAWTEAISEPYGLELILACDGPPGEPSAMLGKGASLRFMRDQEHCLHGIVSELESLSGSAKTSLLRVVVEPALCALRLRCTSRIFAGETAHAVAKAVLAEALQPFEREVVVELAREDYPVLEYLVQQRETDLAFVQRILAEHGLWFFFEHPSDASAERLVITDSPFKARPVAEPAELELVDDREAPALGEVVRSLGTQDELRPTGVSVRHFNWTHPEAYEAHEQLADAPEEPALIHREHGDLTGHEYSAPRYGKHDTQRQAELRLAQARGGRHALGGESNVTSLRPGHFASIEGVEYLITKVEHQGGGGRDGGLQSDRGHYTNRFECQPRDQPYQLARLPKPRVDGPQVAIVVDRAGATSGGEDVVTDEHGRIRVRFPWDPPPGGDAAQAENSCWLRVAQTWAGKGWGSQFIPRVGMEVLVQFVDGDPDRPLVTGSLYNGLFPLPYASEPQRSGIRSRSSVAAEGHNEWAFYDANEQEQIRTHAQRDYDELVLRDHTTTVHEQHTQLVDGSQSESVGADMALSAHGRSKSVGGDESHAVTGERTSIISKKNVVELLNEHEVSVTAAQEQTYLDTPTREVTGTATLEAKADKLEHVVGRFELTTDQARVLKQGKTSSSYEGDKLSVEVGDSLTVVRGPASISTDPSDAVVVNTPAAISFEVGASKLVISASGVELEALQISLKVQGSELSLTPASASIKGQETTVEATAVCQVRGMAMIGLN